MAERMRPAADIIADMKKKFNEAFEGANGQECIGWRVTFKVFKSFPDVPYAQTMHHQTGEMIPISSIKALSCGYDMRHAIGEPLGCKCIPRSPGRYYERYVVKDDEGNPVPNVPYRILDSGKPIQSGVTDSQGRTERIATSRLKHVTLELEH
ncbi:Ig-like domain-containing protein [Paraburkholderia sp. MMS20-SJTR3]|uniref:Ig-like domain-containing protein n=1 Tax=Paraburkholderia sejongensis TaxID=2886946 RepID=A0ABS8JUX8_9BURK|nr:Ig-like domain-containing protein [Paraburkholderia sp. MMS20-SJTR3]MCC8393689.1 Ig-like domain-containing protein [Paraburkholderia sp. MMS20-SJTR3]